MSSNGEVATEAVTFAGLPGVVAIDADVQLRRWDNAHLDELHRIVNANHQYLQQWMPWASTPATAESTSAFLDTSVAAFEAGTEFGYGVFDAGKGLLGGAGLHARRGPGVLEIGYWIAQPHSGRGLGRAVARALTAVAAATPGVERIVICCDEANLRSAAIPRALGYRLDAVEVRPPAAPAETDRHLVWSLSADRALQA